MLLVLHLQIKYMYMYFKYMSFKRHTDRQPLAEFFIQHVLHLKATVIWTNLYSMPQGNLRFLQEAHKLANSYSLEYSRKLK